MATFTVGISLAARAAARGRNVGGRCIISVMGRYVIRGPLTYELAQKDSPIRQFFDDRLAGGLKDIQAAYRAAASRDVVIGVAA